MPKARLTRHRALRRMAGLVFLFVHLLVFWVLAGACRRHGVGGFFFLYNAPSSSSSSCQRNGFGGLVLQSTITQLTAILHRAKNKGPAFYSALSSACAAEGAVEEERDEERKEKRNAERAPLHPVCFVLLCACAASVPATASERADARRVRRRASFPLSPDRRESPKSHESTARQDR